MSDLEARVRRLEDRAELADLVVRYFVAADNDDMDTLGSTFAEDAEFVIGGGFSGGSGRASIVKFIEDDRKNMGVTVHTHNYSLFSFANDDQASGVVGAHLELARGGTTVYGAVRYLDDYVRTDEGWRIKRREMATIHVGPWEDVATSLTSKLRSRWPGQDPAPADLPR